MTQLEFYQTPEVKSAIEIQKRNPFGSIEHRRAHKMIGQVAEYYGIADEYNQSGGHLYD